MFSFAYDVPEDCDSAADKSSSLCLQFKSYRVPAFLNIYTFPFTLKA